MNIRETAELYFEKYQMDQDMGLCEQDTGDEIYCAIGELLQQIPDEALAEKIDLLILEMSDADKKEYFIRGFEKGADNK
jgi:hypothetical protein